MNDYPFLNQAIAAVLKSRREERKLSKRKLAELAHFERVYLIQLEKGEKRPTVNALFFISEALGMKPSEMLRLIEIEVEKLSGATCTKT